MPVSVGGITIQPPGAGSVATTITFGGHTAVMWLDAACTSPATFPTTVAASTTFYADTEGTYTVSCTFNGIEVASSTGTTVPIDVRAGDVSTVAVVLDRSELPTVIGSYVADKTLGLTRTAVKTGAYSAAAGDLVPVDTTSGAVTVTLPTAPADKTIIAVKHIIQGGTNAVTINCGGSDVFNKAGGATAATLSQLNQCQVYEYTASGAIWTVIADDLPLSVLDARFAPIASPTFTGITTAPEFSASGLSGATAASRYVGATASGSPASGTFAVGDFVIDQTGRMFICTVAGSPGTWLQSNSTSVPLDAGLLQFTGGSTSQVFTRPAHASASTSTTAGQLLATYFTAVRSLTITKMAMASHSATTGPPTLIRLGLYTVAGDEALTLVAAIASDTTLFATANTLYERSLSTGGSLPASYALVAGTRYAVGVLVVGGTPGGLSGYTGSNGLQFSTPRMSGVIGGQTDLPTTLAAGALAVDGRSHAVRLAA